MKLNIVDLNPLLLSLTCSGVGFIITIFHEKFIIDTKFALWHARQLCFHDDLPDDIRFKHCASIGNQNVDIFNNIDEKFVVPIFDSFCSPGNRPSRLNGDLLQLLNICLLSFFCDFALSNIHFQKIRIKNLRVTVVHTLI